MSLRQAAQQALEALEWNYNTDLDNIPACEQWAKMLNETITNLRAALAEPEQPHDLLCVCGAEWDIYSDGREELVATPRKPLTPDQVFAIADQHPVEGFDPEIMAFVRAIERAHGIGEQT